MKSCPGQTYAYTRDTPSSAADVTTMILNGWRCATQAIAIKAESVVAQEMGAGQGGELSVCLNVCRFAMQSIRSHAAGSSIDRNAYSVARFCELEITAGTGLRRPWERPVSLTGRTTPSDRRNEAEIEILAGSS